MIKFAGIRRKRRQANYEDKPGSEEELEDDETDNDGEDDEGEDRDDGDERHNATSVARQPHMEPDEPKAQTARLYSILSHEHCDLDTKPVQWRSCHSVHCKV